MALLAQSLIASNDPIQIRIRPINKLLGANEYLLVNGLVLLVLILVRRRAVGRNDERLRQELLEVRA